jgi:hypothetical protein
MNTSNSTVVIRAQSAPWNRAVYLHIGSADGRSQIKEIVLERTDEQIESPPSFTLTIMQAQQLMDDLWHCGLRPVEGAGSAGAMRAVERHLEDMRTLVFHPKDKTNE